MADTTACRVSKGVFVVKGKKKAVKLSRHYEGDDTPDQERVHLCEELSEQVSESLHLMQSELNEKLFDDLLQYVDKQSKGFMPGDREGSRSLQLPEIPTAALVTGVNTSDHAVMFSNLVTLLRSKVTSYIAVLKSKDCSNLRSTMNSCISQVMDSADILDEDEEESQVHSHSHRHISGTLITLENWYKEINKAPSPPKSPRKGQPVIKSYPPIVVILEDLECFSAAVLQDFTNICGRHAHSLPLVFVFGIATTVATIHKLLPQHISSYLCIEKFQASASTEYLAQVIDKIVMEPNIPFKLGGKVFNVLLDIFLYHDFSVLRFIQGFKAALLNHFYYNPVSVMCVNQGDVESQASKLSGNQLDMLRSLPSFRTFIEHQPPAEQIKLLEDESFTRQTIIKFLDSLFDYNSCIVHLLSCLHCFVTKLPGHPLGQRKRELYGMVLNHSLCDSTQYSEAVSLLKALSRDEMVEKLKECCRFLGHSNNESLLEVQTTLMNFKDKFNNLEHLMQTAEDCAEVEEKTESESDNASLPQNFHDLKQKLLGMDKKKKKLTNYEFVRNDTIDYLDSIFRKYLVRPPVFPLHEVLYYNNVAFIKQHVIGKPRSVLENALSKPHYYLNREDLIGDGSAILPSLPDICIVYKLHQECGRLINLYDWLQAFVTIIKADSEDTDIRKEADKTLQARFIRSVSELEFLGYVKSTKRKTDHVARLTWGAC